MTLTINTHVVCILIIYICIAHSLRIVGMVSRGHGYDWLVCVCGWGDGGGARWDAVVVRFARRYEEEFTEIVFGPIR